MKNNFIFAVIASLAVSGVFGGVYFGADNAASAKPIVAATDSTQNPEADTKNPVIAKKPAAKKKVTKKKAAKKVVTKKESAPAETK